MDYENEGFPFRHRSWNSIFRDIDAMMQHAFENVFTDIPQNLVKEEKLPDGSVVRRFGPYVYGYSMTLGEDGKPVVREFGNFKPTIKSQPFPRTSPSLEFKESRQPIVDVMDEGKTVKIVAEMPGVEKEQINVECTGDTAVITAQSGERKYHEEVPLPAKVDANSAQASYKNGVLEISLRKIEAQKKGKKVRIE